MPVDPPRRPGVPLGQRPVTLGQDTARGGALPAPTRRHVWVSSPQGQEDSESPGLLLRWERGPDGVRGQVTYLAVDDHGHPVQVTQVLPAHLIRPV